MLESGVDDYFQAPQKGTGDIVAGSASISSAAIKSEGTACSWVLALFGTAMGVGILYLPLQALI